MTWREEQDHIAKVALSYGLDPKFIMAIRKTEWGSHGREFGVLSVSAPTYDDQLRVCCATVRHRLLDQDKQGHIFQLYIAPDGTHVLRYSDDFIRYLASIYAPAGAGNDPKGLNLNWARNCAWQYCHLIDAEHQGAASATGTG